jgi:glycosyltransferase involved in cell wall biosynthesis
LRVLITNLFVANNSGSEVVVELLADGLRRAGHQPMVCAPTLGPQAMKMRERGHIVVDRVTALPAAPDIIHAQHISVALSALAAFPETPAVFACHSANFEVEAPRPHPQIRRWIAVDDLCRDRCLSRGVPPDRLTVILNAVDFERFARQSPLPQKPRRALLLTKNLAHVEAIRAACAAREIELSELGAAFGRVTDQIERELPNYDLVFATARMALEAAAIGCAVVVCDGRGFAGLLTSERLADWRRLNFGAGLLARPTSPHLVAEAIAAYGANDAGAVTDRLRAEASLTDCVARHLAVYEAALADPEPSLRDVALATASWIEELAPMARGRGWEVLAREQFGLEAEPMTATLVASEQRLAGEMARLSGEAAKQLGSEFGERLSLESRRSAEEARQTAEDARHRAEEAQHFAEETRRRADEATEKLIEASRHAIADIGSRIDDATRSIVSQIQNPPRRAPIREFSSRAWRTIIPATIRAPLFRLRQRLLGRKSP